jgi:hypothetical protein
VFNTLTATAKTKKSNDKKDRGYFISPNPEQQRIKAIFDSSALALSLSVFSKKLHRNILNSLSLSLKSLTLVLKSGNNLFVFLF